MVEAKLRKFVDLNVPFFLHFAPPLPSLFEGRFSRPIMWKNKIVFSNDKQV